MRWTPWRRPTARRSTSAPPSPAAKHEATGLGLFNSPIDRCWHLHPQRYFMTAPLVSLPSCGEPYFKGTNLCHCVFSSGHDSNDVGCAVSHITSVSGTQQQHVHRAIQELCCTSMQHRVNCGLQAITRTMSVRTVQQDLLSTSADSQTRLCLRHICSENCGHSRMTHG